MRSFGPDDAVTVLQIALTDARGIVTAFCDLPCAEVWPRETTAARHDTIAAAGLR